MLEGLDLIPWHNLDCVGGTPTAYDPVEKIPVFLRQLLSSDPEKRAYALGRLYENLLHQGTAFEATPYVVPYSEIAQQINPKWHLANLLAQHDF